MAPWGDDAQSGTFGAPFATLARARDAVRPLIAAGLTQPVTVLIRGGVYRITQPVVFGLEDSGTDTLSVTYAAYPNEQPIISGGRPITGWSAEPNGTWSVILPEVAAGTWTFRELFVNGQRRQRARHPNAGFVRVASAAPNQRLAFTFYESDLPTDTNLSGAELVFLHSWNTSRVSIDHADHAQNLLTVAEPIGFDGPFSYTDMHPRYYVENDLALLDIPGEWHLDELTGKLTYFPMPAEDISTAQVIAPVANELLELRGDFNTGLYVKNVHFVGLAFEHCAWALPSGGYAAGQAGFYEWRDTQTPYVLPAAVTFEQADGCSFEDGRLAHLGGWGIMAGRACRNCSLVGNAITDIAGNGVLIGEDQTRLVAWQAWWFIRPEQAAMGNIVNNNLIEHCGEVFHGCVGLWVGLANNIEVSHNLLRYLPYTGVSIGWLWDATPTTCHSNTVAYNHIHDVMLMLHDGGGIYTLGLQPGTTLHHNLIHTIPDETGSSGNNGIFCDQGSTSLSIDANAIFSVDLSPIRFNMAGVNNISNNTLLLSAVGVPPVAYNATNPADIGMSGNQISVPSSPVDCQNPVFGVVPLAGLEPVYRQRLLGDPPADGCASCNGVPYSGLTYDACRVCGGTALACDIPTVSLWGLLCMSLLMLIAATVVLVAGDANIEKIASHSSSAR